MADKKTMDMITKARTVLMVSQPFYGTLSMQLELVQIDDPRFVNTMAVDGIHLFYHPPFVHKLTEEERVGVVAHEVSHCSYQHMTRRGTRDHRLWNYAGDYVINQDLIDCGFVLPKSRLLDPRFKGMSTDEVYSILHQEQKTMPKYAVGLGPDGQPGVPDDGGCGGVLDAAPAHDKVKSDQVQATWEGQVREAISVATRNAGKLPGHLERLVKQLKKPRVSWREQTRRFTDNSMSKDFSYSQPNRRSQPGGIIMPGYVSDRIHHLVGMIDVSGSVSTAMMIAMVSEMGGALDEGTADKLTLIYADDGVRQVDEFINGDLVTARTMGGGGTDFTDSFKYINEKIPDASCVVYLTDLMTCGWGEEPACPVLWAAYLPDSMYEQYCGRPPFGQVIQVPKE